MFRELSGCLAISLISRAKTLSLADLMLAPAIEFFTITPEWAELGAAHKHCSVAWMARMQGRPSMRATSWERVAELAKAA